MKRKMLITITLVCIMLLNCILPIAQVRAETSTTDVVITLNGNLYNAVKTNLQRNGIPAVYNDAQRTLTMTQEAIASVTTLNLSNFAINDLTGLEIFKNVTSVDLSANKLTEKSNLEVLNNFALDFLDISSNEIPDVSMITGITGIPKVNLHNQKFTRVEIIEVDDSEESNQIDRATFKLPQILSMATENGILNPDWLPEETEPNGPYVNWRVFNGVEVEIVTANKTDSYFSGRYGMTTLRIKVTDPKNPLYNSDISLFYVTVSSEERGIIFKDVNLYNAVKEQLTRNQRINEDLIETDSRNLYQRAYDEPMVLVIKIDDIINNIPSLKVADKKVVDLTGIEKFVGLEKELDVSNNYIEDISKIIELKQEKINEEKKLQERFIKQQTLIKEVKGKMDAEKAKIEENNKKFTDIEKEIDELNKKIKAAQEQQDKIEGLEAEIKTKKDEIAAIEQEIKDLEAVVNGEDADKAAQAEADIKAKKEEKTSLETQIAQLQSALAIAQSSAKEIETLQNQLKTKIEELEKTAIEKQKAQDVFDSYKPTLEARMEKIYRIFEKQYLITNILTAEIAAQTSEEFLNMTKDEAKSYLDAQYTKLGNIENDLTSYESNYIINRFYIPTMTITQIEDRDEQGNVIKDSAGNPVMKTVEEPIENPIKTYFEKLKETTKDAGIGYLKTEIKEIKEVAEILKMANYCFVERVYNKTTECLAREYLLEQIELKQLDGEDYSILNNIYRNLTNVLNDLNTAGNTCEGSVSFENNFEDMYAIAGRIVKASGAEITDNVILPQLKYLDISVNLIENIDEIAQLSELKGLYAGDNEICDISKISWSSMTNLLELDLSFNDISNIKPLEVLRTLVKLNVSKNLLEGAFDFNFSGMPDLRYFNLSQNRIDDIEYLRNQLIYVARAEDKDISEYLKSGKFNIMIHDQMLTMNVEVTNESNLTYVDLPNIFRQAEELDYDRTSFAINSILGNVTNDGKQVILDTSRLGTQQASVQITTGTFEGSSVASPYGVADGTVCTIYYTVLDHTMTPINPGEDNNTVNNVVTDNTVNNTTNNVVDNTTNNVVNNTTNNVVDDPVVEEPTIELGYDTQEEYVLGVSPSTSVADFKQKLTDDYTIEVKSNGEVVENGNMATAMMVVLYDENQEPVAVYEVVVKGDTNGDGYADAVDSGLIKAHRAAVTMLSGSYEKAGDINSDGSIDAIDARLLLYHRAEVPGYVL